MTYKELKNKIKEEQKEFSRRISRAKWLRRPSHRKDMTEEEKEIFISISKDGEYFSEWKIARLSWDFRHRHIVYCTMFNNTPYQKIESPSKSNKPDSRRLDLHKKEWEGQLDEALHNNS